MDAQKGGNSNIKVFCRFRPFNQNQLREKADQVHRIASKKHLIVKDPNKHDEMQFMFDHAFDTSAGQEDVYREVGLPVLNNILDGFNGTIMAYGQTSSGKTHTMQGYDINDREHKGIIPRIIENLFSTIEKSADNLEFKLKVSIFQIYMEKIRDLLDVGKTDLKIRENKAGPYVEHLTEVYISEKIQFYKLIHLGQKNRITCVTNMNAHSSRSHMIFLLTLSQLNTQTSQAKSSKLFLIDLAGSEKVSKTGAEGKVLEQAKKINLSLTSLGKVIKSLSQRIQHIPYRQSKLTRIIKDSLGGNAKTTLIVTCSPHEMHLSETISTLRFGENAQKIKNKPKINRELTVEELQKIIEKLEASNQQKDHWIVTLENYIKADLNSPLPQKQNKQKHSPNVNSLNCTIVTDPLEDKVYSEEEQDLQEKDTREKKLLTHSLQLKSEYSSFPMQDEHVASLEAELMECKENLQSQVKKLYNLKKEYNSLNQNVAELIKENINYQEKQKQYDEKVEKTRQEIAGQYRKHCSLIFGEILKKCSDCTGAVRCFENIEKIVNQKGRPLCFQGEEISLLDFWRSEKKEMEKAIQSEMGKNRMEENFKLNESEKESMRREEQNKKIIQMEDKLDILYREYQQMLALQTNWKVQCQLYQRKLKIKEEKITQLRSMLEEISQQMELINDDYEDTVSVRSKIVKPMKGGFLFK